MLTCEFCGHAFERPNVKGRSPRYCSASHRQRAYVARKIERLETENAELRDRVRQLEAALAERER